MPIGEKQILRFGPYQLDTQCGQVRKNGFGIKLQGQPVQILEILLEKPGELVTREELRQHLWSSDTFVDFDHSLNTAIKRLRQALEDDAETPHYIETIPKRGYRFIGEIDREEPTPDAQETAAVALLPIGQPKPRAPNRARRWRRFSLALFGLLVVASGIAVYVVLKPEPMPRIVGSHVLTKTGTPKLWLAKPLVDRGYIYFQEMGPVSPSGELVGSGTLRVPVGGGEVSAAPVAKGNVTDISRSGSFLLDLPDDQVKDQRDVWMQSPSDEAPRLIVKNGWQAIWSVDGRQIFFVRGKRAEAQLYRANGDGTEVERLATVPKYIWGPHLTPDQARIRFGAAADLGSFWEMGTDGSDPHSVFRGGVGSGGSWSPDGRHYFFASWDGERWSLFSKFETHHWWEKGGSLPAQQLTFGPLSIGIPAISSDGKKLYAVGMERHGELSVYDSRSNMFVPYLGGISACFVDFSRDGQWMTYVSYPEGMLWRSRIDGTERIQLTTAPLDAFNPRWSPDGRLIAFHNPSGGGRIYVISADGGAPLFLGSGEGYLGATDPTWSAEGKSLAYTVHSASEHDLRILDLGTQKSTVVPGSEGMWSSRWSPDGKYLVAIASWPPRKLMLFSFASKTWEELASGLGFFWPSWSRDSKFVYADELAEDGDSMVRIAISDRKNERVASLQGFRSTAYIEDMWDQGWFGLAPDGRPITTRNSGLSDIYAFDLEYK